MVLFFVVLYIIANVLIGWWAARRVKNTQDFVVAGRNLPLMITSAGMFATWFGSETVMGASGEFVEKGVLGVIEDPFGAALCLILIGAFFCRPLYRMNIYTFNDYFRLRYSPRIELISAICMVPSYFGWIAGQLIAMAIILQNLTGLPAFWGVWLCMSLVVFYTTTGGMWAVSITDFVQTVMIILGLVVMASILVGEAGGLHNVYQQAPKGFFNFLPTNNTEQILIYISAWITVGLGSIPQQDVFQRTMSAKSENTAVYGAYLGALMYLSIAFLPLLIALCGKVLYPELVKELHHAKNMEQLLPMMVSKHGGTFLQILFFGALLSAIMSTASGAMLAPATVLGENIIRPRFKEMTDKQLLSILRWSVIFVAICSAIMANMGTSIYELSRQSAAITLVSLFIPLLGGLYWKKSNTLGAMLSILVGMAVWLWVELYAWYYKLPLNFSTLWGLLASTVAMFVGMWVGKPSEKNVQENNFTS
jgi:SSS family transporter